MINQLHQFEEEEEKNKRDSASNSQVACIANGAIQIRIPSIYREERKKADKIRFSAQASISPQEENTKSESFCHLFIYYIIMFCFMQVTGWHRK